MSNTIALHYFLWRVGIKFKVFHLILRNYWLQHYCFVDLVIVILQPDCATTAIVP
jgi:hypothetical protein